MIKLTGDIHFCEFCEKDTPLTNDDDCAECGRNFTAGMEEEDLLIIISTQRELIKMLASFFDSFSDDIPFESVRYNIQTISDYVDENGFDRSSAREALQEIANRLKGN